MPRKPRLPKPGSHPFFTQRDGQPVFIKYMEHEASEALPGAELLVPYLVNGKPVSLFRLRHLFNN